MCESRLRELLDFKWSEFSKPALIFCKEGKHRTGIVASVLEFRATGSLAKAIAEYSAGVEGAGKKSDLVLVRRLCKGE